LATNRVKNLSNSPTPKAEDLLLLVKDPSNLPANYNITVEQLFKNLRSNTTFAMAIAQVVVDKNLQVTGDLDFKNTVNIDPVINVVDSGTSTFTVYATGDYAYTDNRSYEMTIASATQFTVSVDGGTASAPVTVNSDSDHEIDSSNIFVKFTANTGHTTGDKFILNASTPSSINFGASAIVSEDNNINQTETSNNGTILLESGIELSQEVNPLNITSNTSSIIVNGSLHIADNITGSTETVSGDGSGTDAISISTPITFLSTSGGTSSLTLAAGKTGQTKMIVMTVAGSDATLTQANGNLDSGAVATSIVWNAVGESVTLVYTGSKWIPVTSLGATIS
jgi:hypothetical protein